MSAPNSMPSDGSDAAPRDARRFGWFATALGLALLVAAIGFADPATVFAHLRAAKLEWFWASLAASALQTVGLGLRWSRIANLLGLRVGLVRATLECGLSTALNSVLPGGVWGDGLRAVRQASNTHTAVGSTLKAVAVDRLSGQLGLWLVVIAGLPWTWSVFRAALAPLAAQHLQVTLSVSLAALGSAALLTRSSELGRRLLRAGAALLRQAGRVLFTFHAAARHLPISLGLVGLLLLQFEFAARALGVALPTAQLLGLVPLLLVATSLPSAFGGWGLREVAGAILFAAAGVGSSVGVAVCVTFGAFALVSSLPGLLVLLYRQRGPTPPDD